MTGLTAAGELVAKDPTGEAAKSGPWGLAIILLLCVACYFLFKSMSKHMRKVREQFPTHPAPQRPATRPAGRAARASGMASDQKPDTNSDTDTNTDTNTDTDTNTNTDTDTDGAPTSASDQDGSAEAPPKPQA